MITITICVAAEFIAAETLNELLQDGEVVFGEINDISRYYRPALELVDDAQLPDVFEYHITLDEDFPNVAMTIEYRDLSRSQVEERLEACEIEDYELEEEEAA